MSEREDVLVSIAHTISSYRQGELAEPTLAHVDRWASQFSAATQLPFLREFDHVIRQSFVTKKAVQAFLSDLVCSPTLAEPDPAAYWARASFLQIQKDGESQTEMLSLFAERLAQQCGLNLADCGAEGGDYIYLDDVLFTGGRVTSDLEAWISSKAPTKAKVHVILMAWHTGGYYYTRRRLNEAAAVAGKDIEITFWRRRELENRLGRRADSDVLWPAAIPHDPAVQAYVASETHFPFVPRPPGGTLRWFSTEAGRQLLEREFLIAGVKIRSMTPLPKEVIRSLGFSKVGVGFGSLIVTYRNCPNNCPLAMWWGDAEAHSGALHWYPLLSRKTYAASENFQ